MPFGDVVTTVLDHGGDAILASALTAGYLRSRGLRGVIEAHDRRVRELNEDLARWMRDRDDRLRRELASAQMEYKLAVQAADLGRVDLDAIGGELRTWPEVRAERKREPLHEYRDEGSRKLREYDDLVEAEGRIHTLVRRRIGRPFPSFVLTDDGRRILGSWRAPCESEYTKDQVGWRRPVEVDDPSRFELEPSLARLESG